MTNKILHWLARNVQIFLLAFILALAVWVMAVTTSDPDKTESFPQPIPLEFVGQDVSMITVGDLPQSVEVGLNAPESVWDMILADPGSVRAIVDLTGLKAGTHKLKVVIQVTHTPVQVVSVTPGTLDVTLEPLSTIVLPVEISLAGEPAIGYELGEAALSPKEVIVSGPESIVSQVASIQLKLDITNARTNIDGDLPLVALAADDTPLEGISLFPDTVHITLPVEQMGGYRDLAVKVVTVGRAASGYRLASVSAFPAIVTVYSTNLALIESLPGYVETDALDLSGASEYIETRLGLVLPGDVTLVGEQTVSVQVEISAIEDSLTIGYRPVVITGLRSGLIAQVSPVTVDVILSGPIPALESLNLSDIIVTVDASGRGPGTYQLTPIVSIAVGEIVVESILPSTVQVTITGTATPTPR